jgi:sugar phosphate isomerase/epimerase
MMASRRTFLKTSAVAVAATALMPNSLFASAWAVHQNLGLQLYSVRDDMHKDPSGTLKKLADIGYKRVEHADYNDRKFYGYSAVDFKKLLDGFGLLMPSGHTTMTAADYDTAKGDFTDKWKYTIDDAATLGQKYVISPYMEESMRTDSEALKKFMDQFNKCGELCKTHGMKFGYHNHEFEFTTKMGDSNLYDFIMKNTDPALVTQQLDTGNLYGQGTTGEELMKKYPGRYEMMHIKDEIKSSGKGEVGTGYESTYLGKGLIPIHETLLASQKSTITYVIIEHESYQGAAPLDCVKTDLEIMKNWGYKA